MVVFSTALAAMTASCGGSSGSCGKVQPCGGSVVGTYNISAACINQAALNMQLQIDCPGAQVSYGNIHVSGNSSFNADMTYSLTETVSASVSESLPSSCLTQLGITSCAVLDAALQASIGSDPTIQSGHCSGSGTCTCTFVLAPQTNTESGTYTTAGTTLTTTASDGSTSSSAYCVQGSELHVMQVDMTMAMGTIQADIVMTKK
jgi:hypothetical protein